MRSELTRKKGTPPSFRFMSIVAKRLDGRRVKRPLGTGLTEVAYCCTRGMDCKIVNMLIADVERLELYVWFLTCRHYYFVVL